jgi:hypothetical protein
MIAPMNSLGRQDRALDHGLVDGTDLARRELARVGHRDDALVLERDLVDDVRSGRDQVQVELALEPLTHDLQVQQAEEPDPEPEPEGHDVSGS